MRKLKLDELSLSRLLDELDAADARSDDAHGGGNEFFVYRIPAMRIDLMMSRDELASHMVPSRRLGPSGVYFLTGNLIHAQCRCRVHLVTIRNNWQTVDGVVERCRYLQGTAGVHEVFVRFDRPIDPATFAASACRPRILVADDSLVTLRLYAVLLEKLNVELTCVENGLDAVQRALAATYDMIFMDLEMPALDGLSAVRLLRSKGYLRPIIMITARTDTESREACLRMGCDDYLPKPITRTALSNVVERNTPEPLVSGYLNEPGMTDLIDQFVFNLPRVIQRLETAFGVSSRNELAREARQLKGEAGGLGFEPIASIAAEVEERTETAEESEPIREKLTQLIRLCMAARPASSRPPTEPVSPRDESTEVTAAERGEPVEPAAEPDLEDQPAPAETAAPPTKIMTTMN